MHRAYYAHYEFYYYESNTLEYACTLQQVLLASSELFRLTSQTRCPQTTINRQLARKALISAQP